MSFVEHFTSWFTEFGVDVVIDGATYRGMFDDSYAEAFGVAAGSAPWLLLATSDVASSSVGDVLTAGGISYSISRIAPDGTGMTRLSLERL